MDTTLSRKFALRLTGVVFAVAVAVPALAGQDDDKVFASRTDAYAALGFAGSRLVHATPVSYENGVAAYQFVREGEYQALYARVYVESLDEAVAAVFLNGREVPVPNEALPAGGAEKGGEAPNAWCVPDGGWDDTLSQNSCCSGAAISGSTKCFNASDYGTTWKSCIHVCRSQTVGGCIPSGGTDDTLGLYTCCGGSAVPGSTHCLDPRDYGTTWKSCSQVCQ